MDTREILRIVGLAAVAAAVPAILAVMAHAQSAGPANSKAAPPAASAPAALAAKPAQAAAASPTLAQDITVGAAVVGTDGQKIGEVKGVKSDATGRVEEIHVKTGQPFDTGGKVVVIPGQKISKGGQTVQVAMTAAEADKLPALAGKKG